MALQQSGAVTRLTIYKRNIFVQEHNSTYMNKPSMQRIMKSKCANDLTLIRLGESKQIKVL
jgi:hypothetical protein